MNIRIPWFAASCVAVLGAIGVAASQGPDRSLDALLQARLGFSSAQTAALRRGGPVAALLSSTVDREVAVSGAIYVGVPAERLTRLLQDVEKLESGKGFIKTRRLSNPPRLEDFDELVVPAEDLAALRACRPGRCEVKLGQGAFDLLQSIDWKRPGAADRVHALARRTALQYVDAYRRDGNAALAIYLDSDRPQFIADDFSQMVQRARDLPGPVDVLADYLVRYPSGPRPPDTTDFFYWSLAEFGLKPVFRLNHVVVLSSHLGNGARHLVAIKQLYASHYFHTALEVRGVVDDAARPGQASYLVVLNMARSDGLTGLFGGVVKSKVRSRSRASLENALLAIKRLAETAPQ